MASNLLPWTNMSKSHVTSSNILNNRTFDMAQVKLKVRSCGSKIPITWTKWVVDPRYFLFISLHPFLFEEVMKVLSLNFHDAGSLSA